jgi:hypothetical protein
MMSGTGGAGLSVGERLPSRPFSTCPVREGMTRRQRENLELAFWIGVISVELSLFAWLT